MFSDAVMGIMIIIFSLFIGAGAIIFIITWLKHHRVRVRDPINKDCYITDVWVFEKNDKETGDRVWKSCFSKRFKSSRPPTQSINVGKRGRLFAECYKIGEDEYYWIQDKGVQIETIEDKNKKVTYNILNAEGKTVDTFKPYSKTQRATVVLQHQKAVEISKRGKWTPSEIIAIGALGSLVMVIIMGMLFWGDINTSYSNHAAIATSITQKQGEITANLAILSQSMGVNVNKVQISQTAEAQQTSNLIMTDGETPPEGVE